MAALPLTLDTLQTPSNEPSLSLQSPLMSPQQCLKADSLTSSNNSNDMETPERPSNLTLDSSAHQQQQHSNVTPSSSTTTLHGNISPALSSAGSLSPSFLPEMPQWKRDLIQRRKQNVQRTISASSPTSSSSSTTVLSSSPTTLYTLTGGGLKTSISSSSVRSLAGSNTNIDQLASDGLQQVSSTKDLNKTSLFSNTTTKVNKQYIATATSGNTAKPATNIKSPSPLKEKAEKLFGGQYTATTSSSSSSSSSLATFTTKEEICFQQQQQHLLKTKKEFTEKISQEINEMMEEENEQQEHIGAKEDEEEAAEVLNDETKTTTAIITNKQQMATRLTGSSYNTTTNAASSSSTSSSSSSSIIKRAETERDKLILNTTQQYHNNITGANVNFVNQSLNKCESERLVCAANTTNLTFNTTGNSNNLINNTNNSLTIGGISVSGNNCNINQINNCSSVTSVVKISQKLQENQFIKNEQQQLNSKKIIKFKQNTLDLKSPTKISSTLTTSNSTSCLTSSSSSVAASATSLTSSSTNCAIKKKMVAVQEMKKSTQNSATHLHPITSTCQATNRANNRSGVGGGGDSTDLDNSEDLSYGPGIVSKLRCRYLSLALRESMEQQRLNKDQLRRSTSLNNLLDNTEDDENCDDEEEEENLEHEDVENRDFVYKNLKTDSTNASLNNEVCKKSGILKTSINNGQEKRFSHNSQGSHNVGVTFTETSYNKRSRHLKRGNDSLKRARSVEALLSEKSPWHTKANSSAPTCVTIEDKIHNARERLQQGTDHLPPKRLTSIIDDTERPPPDLVKQTLKMFEATANRRPRSTNRSNSKGEVASKVETFKNIIKEQKPVVTYPKPLSPTKKLNSPNLQKHFKTSTPQANDLLQSPLGRKTMAAAATSVNNTNDCLTPLKTNNTLSDHTPDIIPRQTKFSNERDFKQNKEIFSSKEKDPESPLNNVKREMNKEKFEVDSPLTLVCKELSKMKLNDSTPTRNKNDNSKAAVGSSSDNHESEHIGGIVGGGGVGGDNNDGDACQRHNKYPYSNNDFIIKNDETTQQELNISSLKNENDKIINKTKPNNSNNEATSSSPLSIDTKSEATVSYDCLTKASSPPPSSSDLSDGGENYDDDEYGVLKTTKRITRTALDNIAKAGYTQQFKFNSTTINNSSSSSSNTTSSSLNTGKQIGVIRPLLNTQQQQPKSAESNMETLKHSSTTSLTSREIEKNRINDLKKSSTTSSPTTAASSSPLASLDHQVIKPSHTSSPASAGSNTASATGFADVDSVISATNSPLWAMRKRRQAPPTAPAENTSMVFNFSNRKEVPDYIENDGVIFRRKRELPKPNESGFVLLGDLSVETSTDMDYDDFSMCPPSPCDVEFVNANIVIDGKSSIRQKSKDTSFHVQFNDTLTSTFEYPSEASLIVDESFSAYNESYAQPLGSSPLADDFTHVFQNLNLENMASHHHVADEIIQLPTINASSPAATNTQTPTKNILGNLPLDYPDLQKGIPLTTATITNPPTTNATETLQMKTQADNQLQQQDKKKSRKDLNLPLGQQLIALKPPLPAKRFQSMNYPAPVGMSQKLLNSKSLGINSKKFDVAKQQNEETVIPEGEINEEDAKNGNTKAEIPLQRKTPKVLNNPQYACFLKDTLPQAKNPVQRSRSNEFHKNCSTFSHSSKVSRSNSLRNLEYAPANRARSQFNLSSTTGATSFFSAEVNSNETNLNICNNTMANASLNNPPTLNNINKALDNPSNLKILSQLNTFLEINKNRKTLSEEYNERTQSLNNLVDNSQNCLNSRDNLFRSVDNFSSLENSVELTDFKELANLAEDSIKSLENLETSRNSSAKQECSSQLNKNTLATHDNIKCMASFENEVNDIKVNMGALTKHATIKKQNSQENSENITTLRVDLHNLNEKSQILKKSPINSVENSENITTLRVDLHNLNEKSKNLKKSPTNSVEKRKNLPNPENKSPESLDFNCENDYLTKTSKLIETLSDSVLECEKALNLGNNLMEEPCENTNFLKNRTNSPIKSFNKVCLKVNSNYVTDYRSKITENLPSTKPNSFNVKGRKNVQSKSNEHLDESTLKLPSRCTAISNENFSNIIEYSLYRNVKSLDISTNEAKKVENAPKNLSKSLDNIVMVDNIDHLTENLSKSVDNIVMVDNIDHFTDNFSESVDNIESTVNNKDLTNSISKDIDSSKLTVNSVENINNIVKSKDLTVNLIDDIGNVLKPLTKSLENLNVNEINTIPSLKSQSVENLKGNFRETDVDNLNKALQMSRDSLDAYEDAKEINGGNLLPDMQASEILEDIAVGSNSDSLYDFNNLITLKKSKTAYCLKNRDKSSSFESQSYSNSLQSDEDDNTKFISACNTLESKCPLKPCDSNTTQSISVDAKAPEVPLKKPKTLRVKTAEKIFNFTNMASQNASSYATFRKSKNFYKNASKSFKKSLRFYETFNEKSAQSFATESPIKRSVSLMESRVKKTEFNRKIFSKSSKIMTRVKNLEEWDSPTENSNSFEYFDAEGDQNGNLINRGNMRGKSIEENSPIIEINKNLKSEFSLDSHHEIKENQDLKNNLSHDSSDSNYMSESKSALSQNNLANDLNETLVSQKSINLKPITSDFFFNTSPRPFKRIYEATTVVDMEESSNKLEESKEFASLPFKTSEKAAHKSFTLEQKCINSHRISTVSTKSSENLVLEKNTNNLNKFPLNTTPLVVTSSTISLLYAPTALDNSPNCTQRANSLTSLSNKTVSNDCFKRSSSFNVSQKIEIFNQSKKLYENTQKYENFSSSYKKSLQNNNFNNNNSSQFSKNSKKLSNFQNFSDNSPKIANSQNVLEKSNELTNSSYNFPVYSTKSLDSSRNFPNNVPSFLDNSQTLGKFISYGEISSLKAEDFVKMSASGADFSELDVNSSPKVETFKRNLDSTEFSFNLIKFSANSPKFVDHSPKSQSLKKFSDGSSPKKQNLIGNYNKLQLNSPKLTKKFSLNQSLTCEMKIGSNSSTLVHFSDNPESLSSAEKDYCLHSFNLDKSYNKFNLTPTTIPTPTTTPTLTTTTLTVKDFNQACTTTPTSLTTTSTTPTTNFPTEVVALKNSKRTNISYANSSCSSSFFSKRTTNKTYATAKYQQNQKFPNKATTTTTKTFPPAPPLKNVVTTINPPKVVPRRLFVNAPKKATRTITTTFNTTSSTTSSTRLKASTTTTCNSANNNVPPLRRRIPGNTLYYV